MFYFGMHNRMHMKVHKKKNLFISIKLDTRRARPNGKFPVRLRVFRSTPRKQKLYTTTFDFTKKEFAEIWETKRPAQDVREDRRALQALLNRAEDVAYGMEKFDFDIFETLLYDSEYESLPLGKLFDEVIAKLQRSGRHGTAESYRAAKKSFLAFYGEKVSLTEITPEKLEEYESSMLSEEKSPTTVGVYMRNLRAIFNSHIDKKTIDKDLYPFGRNRYMIPQAKNTKKALSREQLRALAEAKNLTKEQEKARDFFLLSFHLAGINMKDLLHLKHSDLQDGKIVFYRAKTSKTKSTRKPIVTYLNVSASDLIAKYCSDGGYLFPVLSESDSSREKHNKVKRFTRFVNQHLQVLCLSNGLPPISTYWARHSWATIAMKSGQSLQFVGESLGHSSSRVTEAYIDSLDHEAKKSFSKQLDLL